MGQAGIESLMTPFYKRKLFWALIGLPNLLSILYFGALAAPQYTSKSSLIVYQSAAADISPTDLQLEQGGGVSVEGDYLIQNFITSWQCFTALDHESLQTAWSKGDLITRFGGVASLFSSNITSLYHYYLGHVSTHIDNNSAIMTLSVRGYDPAFVLALNRDILTKSAQAITHINAQAYENADNFFAPRMRAARDALNAALQAESAQKSPSDATSTLVNDAQANLHTIEAQRLTAQQAALQHLYFMNSINLPSVPPDPTAPNRLLWILAILAGTFLLYLIVKPSN